MTAGWDVLLRIRLLRWICVHRFHLALLLVPATVGCLAEEPLARSPVDQPPAPPAENVVVSTVTVACDGAGEPAPLPPSPADRVRPGPVFFHLGAGYGAVGRVDLSPCRERGLDPGYVRLRVTFGGNGEVAHAAVESATQPPADALACIGERLEAASVPRFEGGDVTLSKSLFVIPDAAGSDVIVRASPSPPRTASR